MSSSRQFSPVSSVAQCIGLFATSWTAARPGLPVHHQLPDDAIQPSPPAFNLYQHQSLSNESVLHIRWPKYWSFSFNISPSNEHSGLISFRKDWLDLLAVQGTLKNLLKHHSSKVSILQCLAFFMVQLSHPYMTTGKTIALTIQTFVGKVISLLLISCLGWRRQWQPTPVLLPGKSMGRGAW